MPSAGVLFHQMSRRASVVLRPSYFKIYVYRKFKAVGLLRSNSPMLIKRSAASSIISKLTKCAAMPAAPLGSLLLPAPQHTRGAAEPSASTPGPTAPRATPTYATPTYTKPAHTIYACLRDSCLRACHPPRETRCRPRRVSHHPSLRARQKQRLATN